ncbi:MAG: DUF302 domain-containing protein [Pseudomonadota bacterium]
MAAAGAFITGCAAGTAPQDDPTSAEASGAGAPTNESSALIERVSAHSFEDTVSKLRDGIAERPLTLFAEIDHAQGAAKAELELAPSTLFIFGNPKGGTPLMTREPRMGITLPLKVHVFEADGQVIVAHQDMTALARQYGLDPEEQPIPNIVGLLDGLTQAATQ